MDRVQFYSHPDCSLHDTGWGHSEHQGRLRAIAQAVGAAMPDLHEKVRPVDADPLAAALGRVLGRRVCVLGIGNRDRRDDGVGSLAAEHLTRLSRALVIDTGTVPENFLEKAAGFCPDTVLLIDAVDFVADGLVIRLVFYKIFFWFKDLRSHWFSRGGLAGRPLPAPAERRYRVPP